MGEAPEAACKSFSFWTSKQNDKIWTKFAEEGCTKITNISPINTTAKNQSTSRVCLAFVTLNSRLVLSLYVHLTDQFAILLAYSVTMSYLKRLKSGGSTNTWSLRFRDELSV